MSSLLNQRAGERVLRGDKTDRLERATLTTPLAEVAAVAHALAAHVEDDPLQSAYEAGFRAGLAESERERAESEGAVAADAAREHAELMLKVSDELIRASVAIAANRRAIADELFAEVGDLVFELVRELVGVELALREEPVRSAVTRALQVAPTDVDLVVRLHPSAAIAAWELESLVPGRRLRVVEDAQIEEGGCVLEVGSTTIDAQIGPALERLRRALVHLHDNPMSEEVA
jgi:flagellar assembly protein FliH